MTYNDLIYSTRPAKFSDYMSNKYNIVHEQLYRDALNKYIEDTIITGISEDQHNLLYNIFIALYNFDFSNYILTIKNYIDNNEIKIDSNIEKIDNSFADLLDEIYNTIDSEVLEYITDTLKIHSIKNNVKLIILNILIKVYLLHTQISNMLGIEFNNIIDFIYNKKHDNGLVFCEDGNDYILLEDDNSVFLDSEYNIEINFIKDIIVVEFNDQDDNNRISSLTNILNESLINSVKDLFKISYNNTHRIVEIKNNEYWESSSIIIYTQILPYKKEKISLEKYWNYYQKHSEKNNDNIFNNNIVDGVISDLDFIRGKAKMYSKMNDEYFYIDFDQINEDTEIDTTLIENTFTNKIIKLRYE